MAAAKTETKKKNKLAYVTMADLNEPWNVDYDAKDIENRQVIIRVENDVFMERFQAAKVEMELCWEALTRMALEQEIV